MCFPLVRVCLSLDRFITRDQPITSSFEILTLKTVVSSTSSDTRKDPELFPEHASTYSATVEGNE